MAAARGGYRIAAFDIFNDADTRRFCVCSNTLPFRDGSFDAAALLHSLDALDAGGVAGVVYGSGFEKQPMLLETIAARFNLLGNKPEVLAWLKDPVRFFALLEQLSIPHPETSNTRPADAGWLLKASGGSGGTHIRLHGAAQEGDYYQRQLQGMPVSVLFLADGKNAQIIGHNEQWLAPTGDMPYRYGGAVSQAELPQELRQQMAHWAAELTLATGMRGINSMDCLLTEQGLVVLEINPRLSATMDLYGIPDLFERHVQACAGKLSLLPEGLSDAKAQHIVYAERDILIQDRFAWPDWVVDRPESGSVVQRDQPLCTVLADAHNASSAKQLAFARARQINAQLRL
jgi:predicted ATP-grasp superfamily ATP-dependent carboligase